MFAQSCRVLAQSCKRPVNGLTVDGTGVYCFDGSWGEGKVACNSGYVIGSDPNIEQLRQTLVERVLKWAPEDGIQPSAIRGVELIRSDAPTECFATVYEPSLCVMVQGQKTVWLGDKKIDYGPLSYLVSSVHLPITGQINDASPDHPYLAVKLPVDPQTVADLVLEVGDQLPDMACPEATCGMCVAHADYPMLDALNRLIGLLDSPADAPILSPLALREILYRALIGEMGPPMRKFAAANTQSNRVSKVITLLKDRFSEPLRIRDLADEVNMSESSLFHSFKQVTRMSPLQFQKKLRLYEARRLMLTEGLEAATASYRVGYESPSHFSREYSRLFGDSPRANVVKLRGEPQVSVQA